MLKLLKVRGDSLSPLFQEGDFVLIAKMPLFFASLKPGDVVVFRRPESGFMIKIVESVNLARDEIYVIGTSEYSVDSRRFGAIHRRDLLGKVIWHIQKPAAA